MFSLLEGDAAAEVVSTGAGSWLSIGMLLVLLVVFYFFMLFCAETLSSLLVNQQVL